jgi:prepilin-type N-terminal cleavage/methylation domain-containing protein
MRSSKWLRVPRSRQRGFGLIEVLIASAILGVALVVLLGSLGSVLIGARIAERQVTEERLARNAIENQMAQPFPSPCPGPSAATGSVDGQSYTTVVTCAGTATMVEYKATVTDSSGSPMTLALDRAAVQ